MRKIVKVILSLSLVFIISCSNSKSDIDISKIDVEINFKQLNKDLIKNYPDTPNVINLMKEYGTFFNLYTQGVLKIGNYNQKEFIPSLIKFNEYCYENGIVEKVEKAFPNIEEQKKELTLAFKHFKYYFPDKNIPDIYTFISAFNQSIVTDSGIIGIALDKYLGKDCEFYKQLAWDRYLVLKMTKEMIPVDCMKAYALMEFAYNDSIDNLLSNIVYEGKIAYFLDVILPKVPDTLKFAYTENQFNWAEKNEELVWSYFLENKLLFNTDALLIKKLIGDGPFTPMFTNNSAPRIGAFIGRKIINSYMDENPEVSLHDLMYNDDYQKIINKAKYRP
ncbi:MAG: hypothetical protein JXR51_05940 [Bacteroidales bacterium]|nr:hypothetical protein [Bacteroidales bacterium]MBN2756702.1 hypothetical protein [Bacteroidales bacterium]